MPASPQPSGRRLSRPQKHFLEASKGPPGGPPRHGARDRQEAGLFRPGDTVRETGIYEVMHDRNHRSAHEAVMLGGDLFPACETCLERVRFRLVRTAPYIFHDEDFEKTSG